MNRTRKNYSIGLLLLLVLCPAVALAEAVAVLSSVEGLVVVRGVKDRGFSAATAGRELSAGDIIRTEAASRAGISFKNGGFLRLSPNTSLQFKPGMETKLFVDNGRAYFFSREAKDAPIVDTPSATLAIRGTEFAVDVTSARSSVTVLDGAVAVQNNSGEVALARGESAVAETGKAPVKVTNLRPLDAVQWALYYPELPIADPDVKKAAELIGSGELEGGNTMLSRAEEHASRLSDPQASQLMAEVLAQRSIVALVSNDKAMAVALADEALSKNPGSPSAMLARSYAAQAELKLEEALVWTEKLSSVAPSSAVALARKSELELAFGRYEAAAETARQAVAADPLNAVALSASGFAELSANRGGAALERFQAAAAADPSFALARLGVGLSRVRTGDLDGGRRDLEQAAFLSPNISVYRSYLGKAYFEEEDERRAGHEYDRAIALDPLDPTPFLYRAYNRISQNDAVGGLRDIEQSIANNGNRAVYRSSLMLDQDEAVRSAGLSTAFTELGFDRAAQVEAIKSINQDYGNYSGHLLLADSYRGFLTAEAAESERETARLFAPLSFNLIRPDRTTRTFGQYDSLFERPQSRTLVEGSYLSSDDAGTAGLQYAERGEQYAFGIFAGSELTGGTTHGSFSRTPETELRVGYQPDVANLFSLSANGVYSESTVDGEAVSQESGLGTGGFTLSYQHTSDPGSKLVAFAGYQALRRRQHVDPDDREIVIVEVDGDRTSESGDMVVLDQRLRTAVQTAKTGFAHVFNGDVVSVQSGTEYHRSWPTRTERSYVVDDEEGLFDLQDYRIEDRGAEALDSVDLYSYSTWHLLPWLDLTGGATFTHVEIGNRYVAPYADGSLAEDHLSPKAGVTLYPLDRLTVRGAYFEGLRKSLLEDAVSIEPNLVGGINQRYAENPGVFSRNFGVGADYKIAGSTYAGIEGIKRFMKTPNAGGATVTTFDYNTETISSDEFVSDRYETFGDENFASAYLSRVFTDRLVGSVQYDYGMYEITDPGSYQKTRLNKVAFDGRYFTAGGFIPYTRLTYRDQSREDVLFPESDGTDVFWITDVGVAYRLPQRHGSISLQLSNIFDEKFDYVQNVFGTEPYLHQGIGVDLIASVNF